MVCDEQDGPVPGQLPAEMDRDTKQPAQLAVIPMGKRAGPMRVREPKHKLHRHEGHGEHEKDHEDQGGAQFSHLIFIPFERNAIELHAVIDELVAKFAGNRFLQLFQLLIVKLDDLAGTHVNQVIVML